LITTCQLLDAPGYVAFQISYGNRRQTRARRSAAHPFHEVMREEGLSMAEEIEWFVGIDWASQSHQVCLVDARGECLGERAVAHGGPGLEELCDWLVARTGATPEVIGVAIEMTQGPVVEALLERGFCVYGINPKQLDRFRDRFTVAGAKSLPSRKRGMTGATLMCWPTACAPIGTPFAVCRTTGQ